MMSPSFTAKGGNFKSQLNSSSSNKFDRDREEVLYNL